MCADILPLLDNVLYCSSTLFYFRKQEVAARIHTGIYSLEVFVQHLLTSSSPLPSTHSSSGHSSLAYVGV